MSKNIFSRQFFFGEIAVLFYLALFKLLLHFLTNNQYGYHRDELLYIALGEHLDFGFVEVPPSIAVFAGLSRRLFGDSLFAIRFFPAVAGALLVLFTGLMARQLGGGGYAQFLAGFSVLLSPAYLRSSTLFQPVCFDQLDWTVGLLLLVVICKHGNQPAGHRAWLYLGMVVGIGMLNKYSMLIFCFGTFMGLLFTSHRRALFTPWPWLGAAIAIIICLPNLLWQIDHGWPFLEHMQKLSEYQLVNVSPVGFMLGQLLMNLFAFPIWFAGLCFYLFSSRGKSYRALGWLYLSILLALLVLSGKDYYLLPAYPMLLAAGGLVIEGFINKRQKLWLKPAIVIFLTFSNLVILPYGIPILPIETFEKYARFAAQHMGLSGPLRWETGRIEKLPQDYADMFGWEEQVKTVAEIYHRLSAEERARCIIFAGNYGEAGAIDYFGRAYGLPKAISTNGSYYLWGPGTRGGDVVITIGVRRETLQAVFAEVEPAALITHPWARENNVPVLLCRKPNTTIQELWPQLKIYQF